MSGGELSAALAAADRTTALCPSCRALPPSHAPGCPSGKSLAGADALLGTVVAGAYHVTRVLGEGGMGKVYEAQHVRIPSRRFALKTLHHELAQNPAVLARFQREAEAAAAIQSPHVIEIYDVNRLADGRPCIIAELLQGKELGEHLAIAGRMPAGAAVRIVRQVCRGLAAAHAKGIVHRDVKPENVFLTGDLARPAVKLLDFGIAGAAQRSELTKTGMVMGTPSYMAPEQARGEQVDHRADIYAVGAILYHALTGQRPFDRDDPTATLVAVMTEEPPSPRSLNPEIPPGLEITLQHAMAKTPAHRPASLHELDAALAPYDEGDASAAAAPAPLSAAPARPRALSQAFGLPATPAAASQMPLLRRLAAFLALTGLGWLWAGLITSLGGLARAFQTDGAALPGSTAGLLALGVSVALLGAALLGGWYVRRRVWQDSDRLDALTGQLAWPITLALGAYGFASLLVRWLEAVLLQRAIGIAWPLWDPLLFFISLGAAAGVAVYHRREHRA